MAAANAAPLTSSGFASNWGGRRCVRGRDDTVGRAKLRKHDRDNGAQPAFPHPSWRSASRRRRRASALFREISGWRKPSAPPFLPSWSFAVLRSRARKRRPCKFRVVSGFDVVPSDCLAAHLKRGLPDATHLTIYLSAGFNVSRGTAKTAIEGIADGLRARRNGRLVTLARPDTGSCNFGKGLRRTIQIPWGDLSTAFHSTGIPNIEVHVEAPPALQALALTPAFVRSLLALPPAQAFLKALADRQPEGPSDEARRRARAVLVGVARNAKGEAVRTRLTTPEGYTLTARTSLDAAMRVAAGEFKPGFQTPSMAFGPDYILGFEGVMREELNA